tara:strand:+ start:102 stop:1262 length:1161 start_codon:yes stop_codon:yes gene_type:complete
MKYNNRLIILIILCFSLLSSANAKVVAAISTMKGLVMVKPVGSRKYIPAYKGQMLKNGEWIKTKDGVFVAIVFLDGSNIKIQQQTEIKITSYRMTAKELKTNLEMSKGQAWSDVASQGSGGEFKITTPTAVASVKGTEFDLEFDIENSATTLVVLEGSVEFAGELGTILAGAMESSKDGGAVKKLAPSELPSWQKSTDPKYSFKLKPNKSGKQKIGSIVKVDIQILNAKSKILNDSYTGIVNVESQSSELQVSTNGSSWSNSVSIQINKGRGVVQVNSFKQGKAELIVSTEDSESKLIGFEYFQSKTQKRAAQNKLSSISEVKGNSKLSKVIEEKKLLRSKVSSGSGNVEDVLNKLETGELELDGDPVVTDNGDGTVTVRMIVKPR